MDLCQQSKVFAFNMLSRLGITFLPRSKHLNFMAAVTICSDFGAPKIKSVTASIVSPSICLEVVELDAMILVFWILSFKPLCTFRLAFLCYSLSLLIWITLLINIKSIHEEGMATHSSILAWRVPMDRGTWQATVHGVAKSETWLSN